MTTKELLSKARDPHLTDSERKDLLREVGSLIERRGHSKVTEQIVGILLGIPSESSDDRG